MLTNLTLTCENKKVKESLNSDNMRLVIHTMLPVLAWPIELLPKEKPVLGVVVVWPNGLNRLLPGGCVWLLNKPPVVVPKPPVAAAAAAGAAHEKDISEGLLGSMELCTNNEFVANLKPQRCFCSAQMRSRCWKQMRQTGLCWHWRWPWLGQTNCPSLLSWGWLGPSYLPGSLPISTPVIKTTPLSALK